MALHVTEPVAAYLVAERRRTRTRFPVASQKTALSTTRGGTIAVVTRSTHGNQRWTRNTDTSCRGSTLKRMEKVAVHARLTGEFPGSPVDPDHIFKLSNDKIDSLEIRS
jgi:hypothetical protein